jgi:hypothetical protein
MHAGSVVAFNESERPADLSNSRSGRTDPRSERKEHNVKNRRIGRCRGSMMGVIVSVATGIVAACGEGAPTGPGSPEGEQSRATTSLSVLVPTSDGVASAALVITRAAMVLREVEIKLQDDDGCDDSSSGSDDCEKFEAGPFLLELPLDGSMEQVAELADVPAGVYDELEFDIHKPEDDTGADLEFLRQHPEFKRVSIRVEGEFNGEDFVYLTDLNEEQEVDLIPPLVVDGSSSSTNVTLVVDVDTWFRRGDGSLVDPGTANKGGANEDLVEENIERSIEGFEDDDRDGRDDSGRRG